MVSRKWNVGCGRLCAEGPAGNFMGLLAGRLRFLIGLLDSFLQSCGEKMALTKEVFMIVQIL
jgi:hypothetical protein